MYTSFNFKQNRYAFIHFGYAWSGYSGLVISIAELLVLICLFAIKYIQYCYTNKMLYIFMPRVTQSF
jgi:hypothetical protein